MPGMNKAVSGRTPEDLLGTVRETGSDSDSAPHSTGILPSQDIEYLIRASKEIVALAPPPAAQIQPASLDLRLGAVAYRVRASFLPGENARVEDRLAELAMHKMDISEGAV